ncbi:hypothetical protein [Nocardia sp. IFM 10818]
MLQLEPELQAALRRGDLAIRDARVLARVPRAEQVERWLQTQEPKPDTGDRQLKDRTPADADSIAKSLKKLAARPDTLAVALVDYLDSDQLQKLVDSLTATLAINDR